MARRARRNNAVASVIIERRHRRLKIRETYRTRPPDSRRPHPCRPTRLPNRRISALAPRWRRASLAARITETVGPPPHACSGNASSSDIEAFGDRNAAPARITLASSFAAVAALIVRQVRCSQSSTALRRRSRRQSRRRAHTRFRAADIPSRAARSRTSGSTRCKNGNCISSECSRACAAGCGCNEARAGGNGRGAVLVNRHRTERRLERAALVNRHALESDVMRRTDQHRDVDVASGKQAICVRRNGPEYISPAWGAIIAIGLPPSGAPARPR